MGISGGAASLRRALPIPPRQRAVLVLPARDDTALFESMSLKPMGRIVRLGLLAFPPRYFSDS